MLNAEPAKAPPNRLARAGFSEAAQTALAAALEQRKAQFAKEPRNPELARERLFGVLMPHPLEQGDVSVLPAPQLLKVLMQGNHYYLDAHQMCAFARAATNLLASRTLFEMYRAERA